MVQSRPASYPAVLFAAGALGVFLVEWWLCRWPAPHPLTAMEAFLSALGYVAAAVLSGACITRLFWFPSSLSLGLFTIASATGWAWVPSVVLLSRQRSMIAVPLAIVAAVVTALHLPKIVPSYSAAGGDGKQRELFANYLSGTPREKVGSIIAVCLYSAFFALHREALCTASFLLALCAFLFTWKVRSDRTYGFGSHESRLRAGLRLARVTSTAILITTGLLLLGLPRGVSSGSMEVLARARKSSGVRTARPGSTSYSNLSGFERIVLWPAPGKKELIVPAPKTTSFSGFNMRKPVTIRFDGSYWYFHPRGNSVGARAHIAHGDPLTANVRSTNYIPLVMEAHQSLAAAIPLSCCREIEVMIENHDNAPGMIALGVLLTDSNSLGKPTVYLDQQAIPSTEPDRFTVKSSPVSEVLSFRVPSRPRIQRFDEITVIFFPDAERPNAGARIAIQQFDLIPR